MLRGFVFIAFAVAGPASPLCEAFEVIVARDPSVFVGDDVELKCTADGLNDDLEGCVWRSPQGVSYNYFRESDDRDVEVDLRQRDDECFLRISRYVAVTKEAQGPLGPLFPLSGRRSVTTGRGPAP